MVVLVIDLSMKWSLLYYKSNLTIPPLNKRVPVIDFISENIDKYTDAVKLLIGNKSDLPRQVTVEEAEKFAMDHGMMYFKHSCKTGSREALLAKLQEAVDKYKMQSG